MKVEIGDWVRFSRRGKDEGWKFGEVLAAVQTTESNHCFNVSGLSVYSDEIFEVRPKVQP